MNHHITIQILILLVIFTKAKIHELPIITQHQTISLRMNQLINIDSSYSQFGNLQNIHSKQVLQTIQQKKYPFPTCYQNPPEVHFTSTLRYNIDGYIPQYGVVYDFQKIKQQRSLIDIAAYQQKIYYMLGNGQFKIQKILDQGKQIVQQKSYHILNKMSNGNIIIMDNAKNEIYKGYGLFINQNQAILFNLQTNQISPINQYQPTKKFHSAIYLEKGYFAVAYGREGMKIFSLNFSNLTFTLLAHYDEQNSDLQNCNINDLAYDSDRKILFILDRKAGVIQMQLIFSGDELFTKQTRSQMNHSDCNLIHYNKFTQDLYVYCREIYKYHINNWPTLHQKKLPPQKISIHKITSIKNIVAFIGTEAFQIIYSKRKTAVYKNNLLDKLILTDNYFISANQYEIIIGNYSIIPPTVSCSTSDPSKIGNHHLVLKITADCNEEYLNKINYPLDKIIRGDQCLYTVCKELNIWKPAILDASPFVNSIIALIALVIVVAIWWVYSFVNLKKLQKDVNDYQNLNQESSTIKQEGLHEAQKVVDASQGSFEMSVAQNKKEQKQSKDDQQ